MRLKQWSNNSDNYLPNCLSLSVQFEGPQVEQPSGLLRHIGPHHLRLHCLLNVWI